MERIYGELCAHNQNTDGMTQALRVSCQSITMPLCITVKY